MCGTKLTRREMLQAAAATAGTALLAACQQPEPTKAPPAPVETLASAEPTSAPTQSAEPVTIAWWNPDAAIWQPAYQKMADTFMEQNADIKVDVQNVPEEGYLEKINAMIAGDMGPDVWPWGYALDTMRHGFINDLTAYLERDAVKPEEMWFPLCQARGKYQGRQYGVPRDSFWTAVVYNKTLFDEFGVPYPQEGWTIDDYLAKAKALANQEKGTWGTLICGPAALRYDTAFGWNLGFEIVSEDGHQVQGLLDSPASIWAIQWILDLQVEHKVAPSGAQTEALGDFPMASGKSGMDTACGLWHISALREVPWEWALVTEPIKEGIEPRAWADSVQYFMWTGSKQKEAAWELMKYISGPVGSNIPAEMDCFPSPCPEAWKALGWDTDPLMSVFWRQTQKPTPIGNHVRTEFDGDCVGPNYDAIFTRYIENGERPLEPLVKEAAATAQACLDQRYAQS